MTTDDKATTISIAKISADHARGQSGGAINSQTRALAVMVSADRARGQCGLAGDEETGPLSDEAKRLRKAVADISSRFKKRVLTWMA